MLVSKKEFLKSSKINHISTDDFGNITLRPTLGNRLGKLNFDDQPALSTHRGGWKSVLEPMFAKFHNPQGVKFYSFLEHPFQWFRHEHTENNIIPFKEDWVGVLHNPPAIPDWYTVPNHLHEDPLFLESLKYCKGLYAMSKYHADFLSNVLPKNIIIESILHPYDDSDFLPFSFYKYKRKKQIVSLGYWLRKQVSFFRVAVPMHKKIKLWPYKENSFSYSFVLRKLYLESERLNTPFSLSSVDHLFQLNDYKYDDLLSRSIVYLDLWDTSANNAIIECIQRGTPVFCSNHPAAIEYLGKDYPLFFDSPDDIKNMLDDALLYDAHLYLIDLRDSNKLSISTFLKTFNNSKIYQSL